MHKLFRQFASRISSMMGSPFAFIIAVILIMTWLVSGPTFNYSNTWQLMINTTTTIVTFLMVFLIQNTQNRDAKATHLKLDELVRAVKGARTGFISAEDMSDEDLQKFQAEFRALHERYNRRVTQTKTGTTIKQSSDIEIKK